jgi:O-antigen/teichoic acid export membrane protein
MAEHGGREAVERRVEAQVPDRSRTIRRNAAALGAGQVFTWSMTLAWTLVVPRLIGAEGMGMIVTGMAVVAMLQIALGAGTAVYVTREIVVSPERAARIVASASIARLILVPVFGLVVVAWAQLAGYGSRQDQVLYLCAAATTILLLCEPLASYFQATERMHYMALLDAISKASQGLAGIVLAVLGFGAIGFAACWVVTAVVVVALCIRWVRRYIDVRWKTTIHDLADVARGSAKYWTGGLFFTIYLWVDTSMLSVMTNPTVVGWYGVPMRLFGTFLIIATIVQRVSLPRLVDAHERSRSDFKRVARGPMDVVFALSLPVMTALVVGAGPVVPLLYGPGYAHAVPVLVILGITLVPMYLNIMLGNICIAANRQGVWNWLMMGATLFNPAVNAFLIPFTQHQYGNGAIGAAVALALTEALIASAAMVIFGRGIVGLTTVRRVGRTALACAGMWLVVHVLRGTGPFLSLGAGCCALAISAIVFGAVTREEQRQIRGIAERSAGKAVAALARLRARAAGLDLAVEIGARLIARISGRLIRTAPPTGPVENATGLSEPPGPREAAPVKV